MLHTFLGLCNPDAFLGVPCPLTVDIYETFLRCLIKATFRPAAIIFTKAGVRTVFINAPICTLWAFAFGNRGDKVLVDISYD